VPRQVRELLKTLKLQWLGKAIGFEKITFKKNSLKGYFISDQQSGYFETEQFSRLLQYVQQNPFDCNLKEVKSSLRISFENITNLDDAIARLTEIVNPVNA
jgi:transcription-repair coupling factor (superfamily II helicase)